jgi:sugar phosphate permease
VNNAAVNNMAAADAPALTYSSAPGRWVLAITVLGSGIAALDATVVNIALPVIGRQFHTSIAALQWVMTGYILTLAAFLLIGGSLGDHFGRRKVYLIGIVCFALASAACGFAPTAGFLIVTRVFRASARRCSRPEAWRSWKRRSCPQTAPGRSGHGQASAGWRWRPGRWSAAT